MLYLLKWQVICNFLGKIEFFGAAGIISVYILPQCTGAFCLCQDGLNENCSDLVYVFYKFENFIQKVILKLSELQTVFFDFSGNEM